MQKVLTTVCFVFVALFILANTGYSAAHRVRPGDTHQKTSKKHGVLTQNVKERNGLKTKALKAGRVLTVAGREADHKKGRLKMARTKKRPAKGMEAEPRETAIQENGADNDEYVEYRLRHGESLDKVAEKFNVDKQEIVDLNRVGKKALKPGSVVYIPRIQEEAEDDAPLVLSDRPSKPWKSEEERGILVKVAKSFAGAPYRYGGDSVRGLDCSAFVRKMYEIFEVQLPRSAREQFCAGPRIDREDLVTGDLVFFRTKRFAKYPTHVGIYLGNDAFIHASSTLKRGVKVDHLSDGYYQRTYTGAIRVKAPPQIDRSDSDASELKSTNNS